MRVSGVVLKFDKRCSVPRSRAVSGVSLIEVMIAIVLSAIGLLALAGVNAASVRYTKMSQYRGTATLLANDISERMRANKAGFNLGSYTYKDDNFSEQGAATALATAQAALSNVCGVGDSCTPAEIAAFDLYHWRSRVRDQLPEGSVFISRESVITGADVFVVWRDPAVADSSDVNELQAAAGECPTGLSLGGDKSVRCAYFRVQL